MISSMDIPLHSRVALKDGADSVYAFALPGSQGWVRDHKKDEDEFPLVFVEWDKDHWRFNNQPDGWTFASHFKIVGDPELPTDPVEALTMPVVDLSLVPPSDEQVEDYIEALTEAMDAASESEGFMILTVRRMPNPENPSEHIFMPQIYTHSVSQEASLLLDIQLAECAASNYEEMIATIIERLRQNGS